MYIILYYILYYITLYIILYYNSINIDEKRKHQRLYLGVEGRKGGTCSSQIFNKLQLTIVLYIIRNNNNIISEIYKHT